MRAILVILCLVAWLAIGFVVQYRMFSYPVGFEWRLLVMVFWPLALFFG